MKSIRIEVNYKKLNFIVSILFTCLLVACTQQTTVDDVQDHQPKDQSTFSLVGKTYI